MQRIIHGTDAFQMLPKRKPAYAGAQLSLDLSSAFDLLAWSLLQRSLEAAEVFPDLRDIIMSWHLEITYHLEHMRQATSIVSSRGLRQGCQLALLLWALATGHLYRLLEQESHPWPVRDWLRQSTTSYADDFHLQP